MRWIAIIASVVAMAPAGFAHAEEDGEGELDRHGGGTLTWNVTEGLQGQVKGVWQIDRQGRQFTGNARMALANGAPLTYRIVGDYKAGTVMVSRLEPSNGALCDYRGAVAPDGTIAGTTFCGTSTSVWSVVPTRSDGPGSSGQRRD